MVIGNVLTATSLGANAFLVDLAEGTDRVELALCRGASWREAALPSLRKAMTAALTPTLNSMAVMGLVMMPGMMTGQMLGGQPPVVAGCYQIMIMYLVCAAGCVATGRDKGAFRDASSDVERSRRETASSEPYDGRPRRNEERGADPQRGKDPLSNR